MIKLFQLVTGETIIGEVNSKEFSSSAQFDINQPLFVFAQPEEEDPKKIRIQLMPYAQLSDNQCVHINFKNVVWSSDPETGLKNQYQTIMGKIVTPPETQKIVTP